MRQYKIIKLSVSLSLSKAIKIDESGFDKLNLTLKNEVSILTPKY